jgi:hypothetical protein
MCAIDYVRGGKNKREGEVYRGGDTEGVEGVYLRVRGDGVV